MALVLCLVAARWFVSPVLWCEFGWRIQTSACQKKNPNPKNQTPPQSQSWGAPSPSAAFGSRQRWAKSPEWFWCDGYKPPCKRAGAAVGTGINFHPGNSSEWNVFEMFKAFQIFTPDWASCQNPGSTCSPLDKGLVCYNLGLRSR